MDGFNEQVFKLTGQLEGKPTKKEQEKEAKEDPPEKVEKKRFFTTSGLRGMMTGGKLEALRQPALFLMRDDNTVDVIEGVRRGIFTMVTKDNKKKWIALTPKKMHCMVYNGKPTYAWFASENEMTGYPTDIVHDGETFYDIMAKISMDKKNLETLAGKKLQMQVIIYIIIGAVVLLYILFGTNIGAKIMSGIGGGG